MGRLRREEATLKAFAATLLALLVACPANAGIWPHKRVKVVDHTPTNWPVQDAVIAWNASVLRATYSFPSGIGYTAGYCPFEEGAVHICVDNYGPTRAVAWTETTTVGGKTVLARVLLNSHYEAVSNGTPDDRAYLIAHELGHVWGLGHNSDPLSVMGNPSITMPSEGDLERVSALYSKRRRRR